jgi:hypothetical protein
MTVEVVEVLEDQGWETVEVLEVLEDRGGKTARSSCERARLARRGARSNLK